MICLSPVRRLFMVGVLVAALAAGACTDKKEPLGPTATLAQPTTTTDPYAVPPVIDEAYVNRVLAGLDKAVGDVTRLIVASRTIPPEAVDRLKAIYLDPDLLQLVVDTYQNDLLNELAGVRANPGDRRTTVVDLLSVEPACVFAKVITDASAVAITPEPTYEQWVAISPVEGSVDRQFNVTNWGFLYEGFTPDLAAPTDPCVAR
jgi:hypothetical protein